MVRCKEPGCPVKSAIFGINGGKGEYCKKHKLADMIDVVNKKCIFDVTKNTFKVAIIPYTYSHTNIKEIVTNSVVNVEFDILGKYVQRMFENRKQN